MHHTRLGRDIEAANQRLDYQMDDDLMTLLASNITKQDQRRSPVAGQPDLQHGDYLARRRCCI